MKRIEEQSRRGDNPRVDEIAAVRAVAWGQPTHPCHARRLEGAAGWAKHRPYSAPFPGHNVSLRLCTLITLCGALRKHAHGSMQGHDHLSPSRSVALHTVETWIRLADPARRW